MTHYITEEVHLFISIVVNHIALVYVPTGQLTMGEISMYVESMVPRIQY